ADATTDFLTVSFSPPDYIGHAFGPNSIEEEDNYLRLDKQLGEFLNFLDVKIGKGQYLLFLSADHGVAHVPAFANEHNIPAGKIDLAELAKTMNSQLETKFGKKDIIRIISNYQVALNLPLIQSSTLNISEIKQWITDYLSKQQGIARVFDIDDLTSTPLNAKVKQMLTNGYYPERCGEIQ